MGSHDWLLAIGMWLEGMGILSKPSPKSSLFSPPHLPMDVDTQRDMKATENVWEPEIEGILYLNQETTKTSTYSYHRGLELQLCPNTRQNKTKQEDSWPWPHLIQHYEKCGISVSEWVDKMVGWISWPKVKKQDSHIGIIPRQKQVRISACKAKHKFQITKP